MKIKKLIIALFAVQFILAACDLSNLNHVVILEIGDNFQQANDENPPFTTFLIKTGGHYLQSVHNPKVGNSWIGEDGAIMDGFDEISEAFSGVAKHVTIQNIKFRNYVNNGINFRSGKNIAIDHVHIRDTGSGDGNKNGAIRVANITGLSVTNSHFERVTAGILPTESKGPIRIENNTALNIGRNFVQLDQVQGEGIRVRFNTMERNGDELRAGASDVEDWISVHMVMGMPLDPAQISYNRARGHGTSLSGAFIILGDGGGKYLIAEGNVGVRPGQVGIGIAGGSFIRINDNIMYSSNSDVSNVAYYSANITDARLCQFHTIQNNRSNWQNGIDQNNFWSDLQCEVKKVGNIFPDYSITDQIWYNSEDFINHAAGQ